MRFYCIFHGSAAQGLRVSESPYRAMPMHPSPQTGQYINCGASFFSISSEEGQKESVRRAAPTSAHKNINNLCPRLHKLNSKDPRKIIPVRKLLQKISNGIYIFWQTYLSITFFEYWVMQSFFARLNYALIVGDTCRLVQFQLETRTRRSVYGSDVVDAAPNPPQEIQQRNTVSRYFAWPSR